MKKYKNTLLPLSALAILLISFTSGCMAPDADNTSARPWNEPRGFDTGIIGRDPRRGF
jgi:hypothetical protein